MRKKLLALLLSFALLTPVLSMFSPLSALAEMSGSGTINDPYIITSSADLRKMEGGDWYTYYKLGNGFTVSSVIGATTDTAASGYLDGNNCRITLSINSSDSYVGLFGFVNGLEVKNLKLSGSVKSSKTTSSTGAIAGLSNGSDITIINCESSVTVSGGRPTGGLIGQAVNGRAVVSDCSVLGAVNGSAETGGILGEGAGYIERCSVSGAVTGHANTGGIIGHTAPSSSPYDTTVSQCMTTGSISCAGNSGGIVGSAVNTVIEDCFATGKITTGTAGSYVGGIVGSGGLTNRSYVYRCYSSSRIEAVNYIGGIAGNNCVVYDSFALNPSIIKKGTTTTRMGRVGGDSSVDVSWCMALESMKLTDHKGTVTPYSDYSGNDGESVPYSKLSNSPNEFIGNGWDFNKVWQMQANQAYPQLRGAFSLSKAFTTISYGDSETLTVQFAYENDYIVSFTSSDSSIVTAELNDGSLNITGASLGTATIYLTSAMGFTTECVVTVIPKMLILDSQKNEVKLPLEAIQGDPTLLSIELFPSSVPLGTIEWFFSHEGVTCSMSSVRAKITISDKVDIGTTVTVTAKHESGAIYIVNFIVVDW